MSEENKTPEEQAQEIPAFNENAAEIGEENNYLQNLPTAPEHQGVFRRNHAVHSI